MARQKIIAINTNKTQNAAKLGLAVAIEAADEAVMEQQETQGAAMSAGSIPF